MHEEYIKQKRKCKWEISENVRAEKKIVCTPFLFFLQNEK